MARPTIVVCEGDQTGQELLEESLRVFDPSVLGAEVELVRFDLSLGAREATDNGVVREAAVAMRETGLGLKAATVTPPERGGVGSPNQILRRGIDGKVIVRTGRRIPGVTPIVALSYPVVVVRMAVGDAYGALEGRDGDPGSRAEEAWRTERIERSVCQSVAEFSFRSARSLGGLVYGGPKWTVSPTYEGMLKEEMDAASTRYPEVEYEPQLIDATYALLISNPGDAMVIPALNRDGDCLSDLVLPMFGSIAGAESVLLAFDDEYDTTCAMAEAPHGTAPALLGKDLANPLAMILACGALLRHAADRHGADCERASRAIYEGTLETIAAGVKTPDLGGHAGTTEFTGAVVERIATKLDVWSSLGS